MNKILSILTPSRVTALILCFLVLSSSCTKINLKTAWSTQEDRIDSFIKSLPTKPDEANPDAPYVKDIVRNGGSNRVILLEGTGEGLRKGGSVTFYYAGYVFNGNLSTNNMFATNNKAQAEAAGWQVDEGDYNATTVTLNSKSALVEGLAKGLEGVKAGEVCYILFSGQYGFGKKPFGVIPGNSALAYQIWVENVSM